VRVSSQIWWRALACAQGIFLPLRRRPRSPKGRCESRGALGRGTGGWIPLLTGSTVTDEDELESGSLRHLSLLSGWCRGGRTKVGRSVVAVRDRGGEEMPLPFAGSKGKKYRAKQALENTQLPRVAGPEYVQDVKKSDARELYAPVSSGQGETCVCV
jgi:hypothetical protein